MHLAACTTEAKVMVNYLTLNYDSRGRKPTRAGQNRESFSFVHFYSLRGFYKKGSMLNRVNPTYTSGCLSIRTFMIPEPISTVWLNV